MIIYGNLRIQEEHISMNTAISQIFIIIRYFDCASSQSCESFSPWALRVFHVPRSESFQIAPYCFVELFPQIYRPESGGANEGQSAKQVVRAPTTLDERLNPNPLELKHALRGGRRVDAEYSSGVRTFSSNPMFRGGGNSGGNGGRGGPGMCIAQ